MVLHGEDAANFDDALIIGIAGVLRGFIICFSWALGIISYKDPENQTKNCFHMAFSIIAYCVSIVGISFDAIGLV